MSYIQDLKEIRAIIKEGDDMGLTSEEVMLNIKCIIPAEIEYIEKEPITTEKQREYMRGWRENRDRVSKIKDRELREQDKLDNCLKRTGFMCNSCGRVKISDPNTNKYEYVQKKNRNRVSIVIINNCPKCKGLIKLFGGYKVK